MQQSTLQPAAIAPPRSVPSAAPGGTDQYLTFSLAGEAFAIGILAIKEIIEHQPVTVVPMMPDYLRGVINLRGAVVPVIDLSLRFGRERREVTRRTCFVIVEAEMNGEKMHMGLVVDAVNAVLSIAAEEIEPPPTFGANTQQRFIMGMGKVNGNFVILLDVGHVLSMQEFGALTALDPALSGGSAT
ncbi:MAG TPA: chemotaxis protein CheW [Steroidobacteraceae bacterium]